MSSKDKNILSVYLGARGKQTPDFDILSTQLHSLIHQNLTKSERKNWQKEINKIENFLRESIIRSNVRSYVFLSSGKNLWQVLDFEFFLPPLCKISNQPYLKPVEESLSKYQKYLVLLFDREKARFFTVRLGKIEEYEDFFNGEVPQNVKAKKTDYGRDDKIFRHIEDHLHRHLKLVSKNAKEFIKGKDVRFIVLGSHKELLSKIKPCLPYPLKEMVSGEFVTEVNIPLAQVLNHSKEVVSRINRRYAGLLDMVESDMDKKGGGD